MKSPVVRCSEKHVCMRVTHTQTHKYWLQSDLVIQLSVRATDVETLQSVELQNSFKTFGFNALRVQLNIGRKSRMANERVAAYKKPNFCFSCCFFLLLLCVCVEAWTLSMLSVDK